MARPDNDMAPGMREHQAAIASPSFMPTPTPAPSSTDQRPAPWRHGADVDATRKIARMLRRMIRGNPEPTPAEWDALGAGLWRGDPLADDVVAWLHDVGMGVGRPMMERVIEHGLGSVPDVPAPLRRFIEAAQTTPAWVQPDLLAAGARFIQSTSLYGMMVLRDAGLMAGYQASALNQTLLMTGALKRGAQGRVAETTSWWMDCTADNGLARYSAGFKTTLRVRVMHALVRQSVSQRPQWDADKWGLPVNQVDMQATYLGFSVVHLLSLRVSGVVVTQKDSEAMMHFWRYLGWLMGVEEDLLSLTEMEGRISLYQNILSQAPPDESSAAMGRALMDEPLSRHYPWAAYVRGRFNRWRHLSIVRLFVGREGMRHLGLPPTLWWYPVLTAPTRLLWTGLHRLVPGGQASLIWRGRARQEAYLPILFGPHRPGVARKLAL